jgi:hypothetical protein
MLSLENSQDGLSDGEAGRRALYPVSASGNETAVTARRQAVGAGDRSAK